MQQSENSQMKRLSAMLTGLSRILNAWAIMGATAAVFVMLGAAGWQVIARYLLTSPPSWTEELARYSMVWAGMLGASCAFRDRSDPALFPAAQDRTGSTGLAFVLIRGVGVLLFVLPVIWFSVIGPRGGFARSFLARAAERDAEMLHVPMVFFAIAIPVAFGLILVHLLADLSTYLTRREDAVDGHG